MFRCDNILEIWAVGFLTNLFGGETNYITMFVALAIVVILIVLSVWLIKVVGQMSQTVGRGRQKRLSIIDSIAIDQKRQAVIIRRDEVEHLIVIGGPNDLIVETGFEAPPAVAAPARPAARRTASAPAVQPEAENPPANVARLDSAFGSKPKSLRHTGLLRANEDSLTELPGGKTEPVPAVLPDSAKSEVSARQEPAFETVSEAGDKDSGETSQSSRN